MGYKKGLMVVRRLTQRAALRYMVAAAVVVALGTLVVQGIRLPWSEEGAIFAIYGAGVGFCLAILCSMALTWLLKRRR